MLSSTMINLITTVLVLLKLTSCLVMTSPSPEVVIPGNQSVVVLFDFHRSMNNDGTCSDFVPRSVELLWSMRWLNDVALRNLTDTPLGLIAYDTCGSVKRTLQILSQYIGDDGCNSDTAVAGVVSYTSPAVQLVISNISESFGILNAHVSDSDYVTSSQGSSISVATTSIWKIKAAVDLVQDMNWNHLTVISTNRTSSTASRDLFLKMAEKYSMCITSSVDYSDDILSKISLSQTAVILFVSHEDPIESILSKVVHSPETYILVISDKSFGIDSFGKNYQNVIFLREDLLKYDAITYYLQNHLQDYSLNGTDLITQSYLSSLSFCDRDDSLQRISCSGTDLLTHLSDHINGRDMIAVFTALVNIQKIRALADSLKCESLSPERCQSALQYVAVGIDQPLEGFPLKTRDLSGGLDLMEAVTYSVYQPWNETGKVAIVNDSTVVTVHDVAWEHFKSFSSDNPCDTSCSKCGSNAKSNDVIMYQPGDIVLHGIFPISGHSDVPCSRISLQGMQMKEAAMYSIHSTNSRYSSLLPNISIGLMISDDCLYDNSFDSSLASTADTTSGVNYDDLRKSMVNIEYIPNRDLSKIKPSSSVPTFLASSLGVSYNRIDYSRYIDDSVNLLVNLNWTYINVIYSESQAADTVFMESLDKFQEKNICFAESIVVRSDRTSLEKDIASLYSPSLKTGAIVMLANNEDSKIVMKILSRHHNHGSQINVITYPWNADVTSDLGSLELRERSISNAAFKAYIGGLNVKNNMKNPLWRQMHEEIHKCSADIRKDMIYPSLCDSDPTVERGSEVSPVTSVIMLAVESAVASLAKVYLDLCPLNNGLCDNFVKSSDLQQLISSKLESVQLQMDGTIYSFSEDSYLKFDKDIINFQLVNSIVKPVKVGSISKDGVLSVNADLVKAYDVNNNSYTPVHQCSDWCPECYACAGKLPKQEVDFHYTSGDIVLAGIFPIHEKDMDPISCGSFTITKGTEQLIEAFMFAVSTATARYPYLLPNVTVGSLVLDSCSDADKIGQRIFNFETCTTTITDTLGPKMVSAYINFENESTASSIDSVVERFHKLSVPLGSNSVPRTESVVSQLYSSYSSTGLHSIVSILLKMNWTYIDLVTSQGSSETERIVEFLKIAKTSGVCVTSISEIDSNVESTMTESRNKLKDSSAGVVVVLCLEEEIQKFFATLVSNPLPKTFVLGEIQKNWFELGNIAIPSGSLVIDRDGKLNSDFRDYFVDVDIQRASGMGNPWLRQFYNTRDACRQQNQQCDPPSDIMFDASRVIFGTDVVLHTLHNKYINLCPQTEGLCRDFAAQGAAVLPESLSNITFDYLGDVKVQYPVEGNDSGTYIIRNFQTNGFVEVGRMEGGSMHLDTDKIFSYGTTGIKLGSPRTSRCYGNCKCVGDQSTNNATGNATSFEAINESIFFETSGAFNNELWIMVVVLVAAGGAVVALGILFYVIYKVCAGVLMKRYIGLGIFLLFSIIFLYLAVLPFAFTPSDQVCAARVFVPGLAYVICFATLLTKLMTLRSYKLIGLGGEISNVNQFLTILFVTGVQISLGVQYLIVKKNFLQTMIDSEGSVWYACVFERDDFVMYLAYAMFLILLCAVYSISVRKEKKNMGEAKLILIFCWLSIFIWAAWITVLFVQPSDFTYPTICMGMLSSATFAIMIIFLPKLHRIARLKYDVKKSGTENGGYKVDPDFMFERPYTLPTASKTSFKYSEKTFPRSLSGFDTSLSY